MNIKRELETKVGITNGIYLNNIDIPPLTIKAIMINEVVPSDPLQDFYGLPDADYLKTHFFKERKRQLLLYKTSYKWVSISQMQ